MLTYCGLTAALARFLKLIFCFEGFLELASVIRFPYYIPIFTTAFPLKAAFRR